MALNFLNDGYFAGSVGIGTESPVGILEVAGNTDTDDNFLIIKDKDSSAGSARPSIRFAKSDGTVLGQLLALDGTNQRLQFSGNNTQDPHLTVYNNGNVGIGTTSPSYRFTAYGSNTNSEIVASFGSANDQNEYTAIGLSGFIASNGATKAGLALKRTGTYGTGELHFLNNNTLDNSDMTLSDSKMMIDASGNVGIGTASPAVRLDFGSATGKAFHLYTSGTDYYGFNMLQYDSGPFSTNIFAGNGGDIKLRTASGTSTQSTRLTVKASGNVGIGTTSPAQDFVVADATNGNGIELVPGATATIQTYNRGTSSYNNINIDTNSARIRSLDYTAFYNGTFTSESMRITSTGNVGIGTTGPQSKLQVAGGIQMADDTATASAAKVGTMRYRTATNEPVPVTGIDLVTNGDFATDTDWTKQNAGSTISGGKLNQASVPNGQNVYQTPPLTVGSIYSATFTISNYTAGGVRILIGSTGATATKSSNGTFTVTATAAGNTTLYIQSIGTTTLSIDDISVIEVTEENASYADMCMQTGASIYEWVNIVRNTY